MMTANYIASADPTASMTECLTFRLDNAEYGIDTLAVQEIRTFAALTRIANAPAEVLGVMNLRGVIVPIVDLRIKWACPTVAYSASTVVIVLDLNGLVSGLVVDSVADVVQLAPGDIKPPPQVDALKAEGCISGIATTAGRMLLLLDTDRLLRSSGIHQATVTN